MSPLVARVLFVAIMAALSVVRLPFMLRHRRTHHDKAVDRRDLRERLLMRTGTLTALSGVWIFTDGFGFADVVAPDALRLGGALVGFIGVLGLLWTHRALGDHWSMTLELKREHAVVERGPYRFVRHPMYTTLAVAFVGASIVAANWIVAAVVVVPFVLLVALRVGREERMLVDELSEPYRRYMSRTKRFVPFLW